MKKRLLSAFLILVMMLSLIPAMSFPALAAGTEYSEMFFHYGMYGETDHYNLRGFVYEKDDCWDIGDDTKRTIRITPKTNDYIITGIRLIFDTTADYDAVRCSSGEKGVNYGDTSVEFENVNSMSVEISSSTLQYADSLHNGGAAPHQSPSGTASRCGSVTARI